MRPRETRAPRGATFAGPGDGVTWTGHYLAALALRQNVEHSEETLGEIVDVLDRLDALISMTGHEGYVPRYAGPADDPAYARYYSQYGRGPSLFRPGLGTRAYHCVAPYEDLVWLGNSSRDTYDGVHFGLAAAWVYVDDEEVRANVKSLVIRIGRRLEADRLFVCDGRGHVTGDDDATATATLEGCLLDFPDEKSAEPVDNRALPGVEMRDDRFARYAFLPSERPHNDFLWQRPPALAVRTLDAPREYPGIDMFLPYWMARAAGVFAPE
jgi:hypothetical protein